MAFHESDNIGGIFVAGATGERFGASRRGFHPAWSPDGKQIAFATEESRAGALGVSALRRGVAGGPPRKVVEATPRSLMVAVEHIVYWRNMGAARYFTWPRRRRARAGDKDAADRLVAGLVTGRQDHLYLA